MRTAGAPKCASAPRVDCSLQYGCKLVRWGLGEPCVARLATGWGIRSRDEAAARLYAARSDPVSANPQVRAADLADLGNLTPPWRSVANGSRRGPRVA